MALKIRIHLGVPFAPGKAYRQAIGVRLIALLLLSEASHALWRSAMESRYRAVSRSPIDSGAWIYAKSPTRVSGEITSKRDKPCRHQLTSVDRNRVADRDPPPCWRSGSAVNQVVIAELPVIRPPLRQARISTSDVCRQKLLDSSIRSAILSSSA